MALWSELSESLLPAWEVSSDGRARIPRAAGAALRVRFSGPTLASGWHELSPDSGPLVLSLEPAHRTAVSLLGPDGDPVEGGLSLFLPGPIRDLHRSIQLTDRKGVAELLGLPRELEVVVVATAPETLPVRLKARPERLPAEVRLRAGCTVTGALLGEQDEPLVGVDVRAEGFAEGATGILVRNQGESDAEGRFRVGPLPPRPSVLVFEKQGRAQRSLRLNLTDCVGDHEAGRVVMVPARRVVVKVVDDLGGAVSGAALSTSSGERSVSDEEGVAILNSMARNEGFGLEVSAPRHLSAERAVPPPVPDHLEVELQRAAVVRGRLVDSSGQPLQTATLRVGRGDYFRNETVAADGTFILDLKPDREHELLFRSQSTLPMEKKIMPLAAGTDLDLGDLIPASGRAVTGRLLRADTLQPVTGASVWSLRSAVPGGAVVAWAFGDRVSTRSDEEGIFLLAGLQTGPVVLRLEAPDLAPREVSCPGADEEAITDVEDVLLHPGSTLEITVDARDGSVARADWKGGWREMDMIQGTVADGEAWLDHVPAGPVIVTVVEDRRLRCEEHVDVPQDDVVQVGCEEASVRVSGTVRVGGIAAGPGTLVWLSGDAGDTLIINRRSSLGATEAQIFGAGRPQVDVAVASDGRFVSEDLPPGNWWVFWKADGGEATRPRAVELPSQGEIELSLDFAPYALRGRVVDGDARPVADARVEDLDARAAARSDAEGRFQLLDVEPGSHRVYAHKGEVRSEVLSLVVEEDRLPDPVVLVLDRAAQERLSLSVLGDQGAVPGAFVFLETSDGELRMLTANAVGKAETGLPPPLPAQVRLAVAAGQRFSFGEWTETETALNEGLVATLGEAGGLEVKASRARGEVQLISAGGWEVTALLRLLGSPPRVAPEAPLLVSGLPPGRYEILVDGTNRVAFVERGRVETVNLD